MGFTTPDHNSVTPYSSRRSVSNYCTFIDGKLYLIKDPYPGPDVCVDVTPKTPPTEVYIGIPGESSFGLGPDGCRSLARGQALKGSLGSWASGVKTAANMTTDWAYGKGPTETYFNTDTVQSQQMMGAPGLASAISSFLAGGPSSGHVDFGLHGLVSAGLNPTAQFVGSYNWSMAKGGGNLNITITNTTTMYSAFYHAPGLNPNPPTRTSWSPMGKVDQTFFIDVSCF
jgi:hypothetical protein